MSSVKTPSVAEEKKKQKAFALSSVKSLSGGDGEINWLLGAWVHLGWMKYLMEGKLETQFLNQWKLIMWLNG